MFSSPLFYTLLNGNRFCLLFKFIKYRNFTDYVIRVGVM